MLIERPPILYRLLFREAVWLVPRPGRKEAFLTFDDGPIPQATPWVLDVLDAYDAKAVFFMVGENAMRHPDLVREVLDRGHAIGNHTMRHSQGIKMPTSRYLADVAEAGQSLAQIAGSCKDLDNNAGSRLDPSPAGMLFRPPHGLMRPGQQKALIAQGYRIVMHDVVSRDYDASLSPERVARNVTRYARPGSVIVFHDSLKALRNLRHALPQSLAFLRSAGFSFPLLP